MVQSHSIALLYITCFISSFTMRNIYDLDHTNTIQTCQFPHHHNLLGTTLPANFGRERRHIANRKHAYSITLAPAQKHTVYRRGNEWRIRTVSRSRLALATCLNITRAMCDYYYMFFQTTNPFTMTRRLCWLPPMYNILLYIL